MRVFAIVAAAVLAFSARSAYAAAPADTLPGVLEFTPAPGESTAAEPEAPAVVAAAEVEWLSARFGEQLLTEPEAWTPGRHHHHRLDPVIDYNRVDPLRLGLSGEVQNPASMAPRFGARLEYSTARERVLYGAQLEQPLLPRSQLAIGADVTRRTDHEELQQVGDIENSLALLFARQDYRDYFEREGFGAYLAWRVPEISVISVHLRSNRYRSLPLFENTRSWLLRDRPLRDNPPIDEGRIHSALLRLERQARLGARARAGFYHEIELEVAGGSLGGDFRYTRLLGDVHSVVRLSPANTAVLRLVAGYTESGTLPAQKRFTLGGVDGLRAHATSEYRGDQVLLGQAEYSTALLHMRTHLFEAGLRALAFLDVGHAWDAPERRWGIGRQHMETDGGLGIATAEDRLRLYVARDLQRARASAVVTLRLQRPF